MRRSGSVRSAVAASVGVHALLAVGLVLLLRWHSDRSDDATTAPSIDTRAEVRFEFLEEDASPAAEAQAEISRPPLAENSPPLANAIAIPRTLPAELSALLRIPPPVVSPVVEVPVTPAVSAEPRPKPGPAWATGGTAAHGPLAPQQTIVYVLDASGSMGEWGKFDTARGALIATLKLQPESVRFQIVIYAGSATLPIRAAPGECLAATASNIDRAIEALRTLDSPAGRSNHIDGLRAALALRPDLVLFFTDADDLPMAPLRGALKQAAKPATVCLARVAARRVETPVELK